MVHVTADTDTEAAPLFREVGATWYWVLAGPISAAIMLWIEKSNGNGWLISVPVFFLVIGMQLKFESLRGELSRTRRLALPVLAAAIDKSGFPLFGRDIFIWIASSCSTIV